MTGASPRVSYLLMLLGWDIDSFERQLSQEPTEILDAARELLVPLVALKNLHAYIAYKAQAGVIMLETEALSRDLSISPSRSKP